MKEKKNYIDNIPKINDMKWDVSEDGRYSFIKLDEYGSFVWQKIDGKKSIYEIGKELQAVHEGAATQLYERLSQYFAILERNKYIVFEE